MAKQGIKKCGAAHTYSLKKSAMLHKKEKRKSGRFGRILKRCMATFLVCAVCLILFMGGYILGIDEWKEFDPAVVEDMAQSLSIYDEQGALYQVLSGEEHRVYTPIDQIPKYVQDAFIAIEDARFYSHNGVDVVRIMGAIVQDVKSGTLKEGASTISQQLVKLTTLTTQKNFSRKFAEMIMAMKLESTYTKTQILEFYLNRVYFGNGAHGVGTAAQRYFGKTAGELTVAEAALLAAQLKSPTNYDPYAKPENALNRRNLVLAQMKEYGFINGAQYATAISEPIELVEKQAATYDYGYYTDMVLEEASAQLSMTYTELMESGYKIYTYLDQDAQAYLEAYGKNAENFPANAEDGELCQTAAVLLDAKNGGVQAVLGGRSHEARLSLNRATSMKRQPGSAIKPIMVYAPAIEYEGYSTVSLLLDQPEDFSGYIPRNSGSNYRGWVTLRDAVAYSINIPAVKLLQQVGVDSAKKYASNVGIEFDEQDDSLTLALGGFTKGVSPMELAGGYLPFASGGYYTAPGSISRIENASGEVVYARDEQMHNVLSSETAYIMTSMLSSTAEFGTAKTVGATGIPIAAKTGTSTYDDASNNKDAWTVAYNSEYVMCSWIGFDKTDDAHSLPKGTTGGGYPAQMAAGIFSRLYENKTAPEFTLPNSVVEVEIDKAQLEDNLQIAPASASTQSVVECFAKKTMPSELQPAATSVQVLQGEEGPNIRFIGYAGYTYLIERKAAGEEKYTVVGRQNGSGTVVDKQAVAGISYTYRITPEELYEPAHMVEYLYVPKK